MTDPEFYAPVAVVVVIAGSVVVCNAAFEACAALVARATALGGTVCKESEQSCTKLPGLITADTPQLQHSFGRAADFGVNGPWNSQNGQAFANSLRAFVADVSGPVIHTQGTAWGQPAVLNYNPTTAQLVVQYPDGSFWSAFTLTPEQLSNVVSRASIGEH